MPEPFGDIPRSVAYPAGTRYFSGRRGYDGETITDDRGGYWMLQGGAWVDLNTAAYGHTGPYGPMAEGATDAATQNATARAKTSQLLYGAMRGLPYISQEYLAALGAGETPAPRTMTPQTLAALANDQFLSDNFFALLEAAGLYPTSFLAEAGRFQPRGVQAAPSFI